MKKQVLSFVLLFASTYASAANSGFYVLGNIGASIDPWTLKSGAASQAGVAESKVSDGNAASSMFELGVGQRINQNLAIEGSYLRNGSANRLNGTGSLDYEILRTVVAGIIPVNERFKAYGKLSANVFLSEFHSSNATLSSSRDSSFGIGLGVGVAYNLSKEVNLRFEYERLGDIKHKDITDSAPVSILKMGLTYRFF